MSDSYKELIKEKLEEYLTDIFNSKSIDKAKESSILYVTQDKEKNLLYFKFGNLTTGLDGFLNLISESFCWFTEIYFNGVKLDKDQRKQFWEQTNEYLKERKKQKDENT